LRGFKRWAWTIPVGAVVLTAVIVGAVLGAGSGGGVDCSGATIDCLSVSR
jgi:hypothetical protein